MPNAQPEQATGRDDSEFPTPEPAASQVAAPGQPTLQEFLTRLVGNPETRSAFDADPRGTLDNAGLGDLNATQVLHASSLMLDYAPADVVTEHDRTAQPSIDTFTASTQHVAINQLEPGQNNEQQEATETMSVDNSPSPNYSSDGDVDQEMDQNQEQSQETNVNVDGSVEQNDSHNLLSVHDVASGNDIANNAVGSVDNTVGTVGGTVDNTVDGALGTVNGTVDTGVDVAVGAGGAALGTVNSTLDDATSTVDTTASNVTDGSTLDGATGAVDNTLDGATGAVGGVTGGVAGGVVDEAEGVVGGVTSDLPLDAL